MHALARLEPASGLIIVGARPGARIERIEIGPADSVTPGQVLAILEGHDQARAQVALAEAQKTQGTAPAIGAETEAGSGAGAVRQDFRSPSLNRPCGVFASKQRFDEITKLYKELQPTLQGKDRFDLELRYFEAETQSLRGELEIKSYQIAQELAPRQRELEDEELGETGPDLDLLDRQIGSGPRRVGPDRGTGALGRAGARSCWPTPVRSAAARCLPWATCRRWSRPPRSIRPTSPGSEAGDPATVQVLDQAVTGKVTLIGSVVGKNQLTNLDPRALQDRRVVKVTIGLDDPVLAARFVNMQVEAAIKPGAGTVAKLGSRNRRPLTRTW